MPNGSYDGTPDAATPSPEPGLEAPAAPATPDEVRAAAERFKSAVDQHLAAVEARTGEQDPAVQAAFESLQTAAETYDELLYEVYDEVTPFEFGVGEGDVDLPEGVEEIPPVVSLFLRRDYLLADPPALLEAGRAAHQALLAAGLQPEGDAEAPPEHLGGALYELFHAAGVDGLDESAEDAGLDPLGGTVWFVAGDENTPESRAEAHAGPFAGADPKRLIYRVDEVVGDDAALG